MNIPDREISLPYRILILFILTSAILIAQSIYNILSISEVDESIVTVHQTTIQLEHISTDISIPISNIRILSMELVLAPKSNLADIINEKIELEIENVKTSMLALNDDLIAEEKLSVKVGFSEFNAIRRAWHDYLIALDKTRYYVAQSIRVASFISSTQQEKEAYEILLRRLEEFNKIQLGASENVFSSAQTNSTFTFWMLVITTIIEVAILIFIMFVIIRMVLSYVKEKNLYEKSLDDTKDRANASSLKLELILSSVGEGIYGLNMDGKTTFVNPATEKMTGFTEQEMVGNSAHELIHHTYPDGTNYPPNKCHIYQAIERNESVKEDGEVFWRKDGTSFPAEYMSTPIYNRDGKKEGIVVIFRDITERKKADEELTRHRDQLHATVKALGREVEQTKKLHEQLIDVSHRAGMAEVASSVLHNVGNVLNGINISSNLLQRKLEASNIIQLSKASCVVEPHLDDMAGFVNNHEQGKHLGNLVVALGKQLDTERTDMSKLSTNIITGVDHIKEIIALQQDTANYKGVIEECSLRDIIIDALAINDEIINQKNITVETRFENSTKIRIDRNKALQIVINLMTNALDAISSIHTDSGILNISVFINDDSTLCMSIRDNGSGITDSEHENLFTLGFTTKDDGHGFGLHTSSIAAISLGGSLKVSSEGRDRGAEFLLSIPYEVAM